MEGKHCRVEDDQRNGATTANYQGISEAELHHIQEDMLSDEILDIDDFSLSDESISISNHEIDDLYMHLSSIRTIKNQNAVEDRCSPTPTTKIEEVLLKTVHDLQNEVVILRREVNDLKSINRRSTALLRPPMLYAKRMNTSHPPYNFPPPLSTSLSSPLDNLEILKEAHPPSPESSQLLQSKSKPTSLIKKRKTCNENRGRWTDEEHALFLQGYKRYGRRWRKITELITTRTDLQIRTHAQKYFKRVQRKAEREIDGTESLDSSSGSTAIKTCFSNTDFASRRETKLLSLPADIRNRTESLSPCLNSMQSMSKPVTPLAMDKDVSMATSTASSVLNKNLERNSISLPSTQVDDKLLASYYTSESEYANENAEKSLI